MERGRLGILRRLASENTWVFKNSRTEKCSRISIRGRHTPTCHTGAFGFREKEVLMGGPRRALTESILGN